MPTRRFSLRTARREPFFTVTGSRLPSALAGLMLALAVGGCTITDIGGRDTGSGSGPGQRAPVTEAGVQAAGGHRMSGADVRSILTRARYRWEGAAGASGNATTTPDGRIRVVWDSGAVNGRIRFNESGYCSRFDGVRGGAEDCYRLYRVAPGEYEVFRVDGSRSGRIRITG